MISARENHAGEARMNRERQPAQTFVALSDTYARAGACPAPRERRQPRRVCDGLVPYMSR